MDTTILTYSVLGSVVCIFLYVYHLYRTRHFRALASLIPGPPRVPLLGHALDFLGHSDDTFDHLLSLRRKYGPVSAIWLGPRLYVLISTPQDVEAVLGNARVRNRDAAMCWVIERIFGTSILTSANAKWKSHRKLITPLFHFKILETYVEVFGRKTAVLVDSLERLADGRTFDVYSYLSLATLDSICETAIGINMNTQVEGENAFGAAIIKGIELVHDRVIRPWLHFSWLYSFSETSKKAVSTIKVLQSFTEKIISNKFAEYQSGKLSQEYVTSGDKRIVPFSDMLIASSENASALLTKEEIRSEVTTVAASGLETTATAMSCLMVLLAMHPEAQEAICKELTEVFGDDHRLATIDDINKLQYMKRAIKETLRLFPAVTLLPRELTEDIPLSSGFTLPAGCSAVVLSYITHHDEAYWPEPERFNPDRWLEENSTDRHPYAYIPFSAGPRNCVGQKYALLQMLSMMSSVFRRYHVTTNTRLEEMKKIRVSMTSRPVIGYNIQLHRKVGRATEPPKMTPAV